MTLSLTTTTLAGWISLITILAEYLEKSGSQVTIPSRDKHFMMRNRVPPPSWSIFVATINGIAWKSKYKHYSIGVNGVIEQHHLPQFVVTNANSNTQISSFGIGNVFFQVFSCPNEGLVTDYRIAMKAKGFMKLWPAPTGFWPFTKGTAKFPTKLVLDDVEADVMADAFQERLKILTGAGSVERYRP